jgi:hypothetical protein
MHHETTISWSDKGGVEVGASYKQTGMITDLGVTYDGVWTGLGRRPETEVADRID